MDFEHAKALFLLAGIEARKFHQLANKYWPDADGYAEVRRENPWWLVETPYGLVEIGWRKRVISIDWNDTPVREIVTEDDVTKDATMVHAWSYAKAVEYLSCWRAVAARRR